jgi:hypothetical protein
LPFRFVSALLLFAALLPATSQAQTTVSGIQDKSGWISEPDIWAKGTHKPVFWMKQNVSSPSLDGQSAQFFLGGSVPYSSALHHRKLTTTSASVKNYVYDMMLYIDHPESAQALEFAVLQSVPGHWYKFSTQCSYGQNLWRVYDALNHHWVNTSTKCERLPAFKWNHLTFEYQRTSDGKSRWIAITVNGTRHYINKTTTPGKITGKSYTLTAHFQMDGNRNQDDYSCWIDKMSVKYW